jgi:putative transposase
MKKRFTEEQIVVILRDIAASDKPVPEACRAAGISTATYYIWKRKFGSLEESDVKRLRELEKENARLKRILAEHVVEIDAMKELISKKL